MVSSDSAFNLMNTYGGRIGSNTPTLTGFNWNTGDQNVCYLSTTAFYTESGSRALPI